MSLATTQNRLPWEDRWNQPQLEELLAVYEDPIKRNVLDTLIKKFSAFDGITLSLHWHGTAWKWTVQFNLLDPTGKPIGLMAYLVPNPEAPRLCITLNKQTISQLPVKRLNRYVRERIRSSKCAVDLHWAVWTPSAQSEVEHLTDLFKRKYKIMLADAKESANASNRGSSSPRKNSQKNS